MLDRIRTALAELEDIHETIESTMLTWHDSDLGISFEQAAVGRSGIWRSFVALSDALEVMEDEE